MPPEETILVPFGNYSLKVQSAEDQLVKTVFDVHQILHGRVIDPKQFDDARLLRRIVDMDKVEKCWQHKEISALSFNQAYEQAETYAKEHPELLKSHPFKVPAPYVCAECVTSEEFPVTPMAEIFRVLGYVE